jgi:hypothetical protein
MLTFAILMVLEDDFGVGSRGLADASAAIYRYLSSPRQTPPEEWVFVPLRGVEAHRVQEQTIAAAGWIVDVAKARERIDIYLGVRPTQQEFPLMTDVKSSRQ